MKSFKEYLTESKKIYEFKVKIAGDCPPDCTSQIKVALAQFNPTGVSAGKRTPIQERHSEFPEHKNVNMTVFDVTTDYPATNRQIHDMLAAHLGMPASCIKVKNMAEELEHEINHEHDKRTHRAIGGTMQEPSDNSDLVGEKHKMKFLQELGKEKHQGTHYKGINDDILAQSVPGLAKEYRKEKQSTVEQAHASPIGTKQNKIPSPIGVR
jgi:hypothetical protein